MSDPRFSRLKTDPRFRRPKVKQTRVVVDDRFKAVFKQRKRKDGPKVDKYGRPVSGFEQGENLRRYYRLSNDAEDETSLQSRRPDLARGEVVLESSDEEDQTRVFDEDDSEEDGGFVTLGADPSHPREEESFRAVDLDEVNYTDLDLQAESYSQAYAKQEKETEQGVGENSAEEPTRTSRLAIVNLDWDHVRAQHLYKICSSLVSPSAPATSYSVLQNSSSPALDVGINYERQKGNSKGTHRASHAHLRVVRGQVRSVRVYPSEFGKGRMEREEREGPPKEIFNKKDEKGEVEVNERTVYDLGDGEKGEYDVDALRRYQLERLRYYYAIVECDTVQAATHIFNELEGTELERSANVFDVSFVPEDMTFEGEPRDEATDDLNTEYKPVEFVTAALRHSKVKLTWDDDDPERHQVTRRALTKREIEEGDFGNYVGGSSAESSYGEDWGGRTNKKGKKDRKTERDKLRALLLGGNGDEMPEGWGADDDGGEIGKDNLDDVDMEITFLPALSKKVGEEDETTLERYQRKVKEKRKKRKGEKVEGEVEKEKDEFFEASGGEPGENDGEGGEKRRDKSKKGQRSRPNEKRRDNLDEPPQKEATAAELALLVASDKPTDDPKHFNIKSVIKAERTKKRKGKGKKAQKDRMEEDNEIQEGFVMNVGDERFKALFEDHQFAVDPSNPHFMKTKAMTAVLAERQKRRREQVEKTDEVRSSSIKPGGSSLDNTSGGANSKSLQSLVESVKRRSANAVLPGVGKRRKLS